MFDDTFEIAEWLAPMLVALATLIAFAVFLRRLGSSRVSGEPTLLRVPPEKLSLIPPEIIERYSLPEGTEVVEPPPDALGGR